MFQLIRKNPMLAAGILLPVVVVVFFVLATAIPRMLVEPPQYDFLFQSMQSPSTGLPIEITIAVEDERIKARAFKTERNYRSIPKLFLVDVESQIVREIAIELPDDLDSFENGTYLEIPDLASRVVSTSRTAPDGYEVRGPGYRGGDFFPFFRGGRSYSFTLHKSGAVVDVPQAEGSYYYNASFLGWLMD